jgi:hypothetical protein
MFNWEITVMPKPSPDDTFLYIFKVYYHLLLPAASIQPSINSKLFDKSKTLGWNRKKNTSK